MIRTQYNGIIEPEGTIKVTHDEEEPGVLLISTGDPDFVIAPAELGGGRLDILGRTTIEACPKCDAEGPHPVYLLERSLAVIGCTACKQHVWVRRGDTKEGTS